MLLTKQLLCALVMPLLYGATSRAVARRILTNVTLTMRRCHYERHLENAVKIASANLMLLVRDKLRFLLLLLPFRWLRRLIPRAGSIGELSRLNRALEAGRGAIVFTGHIGSYYLLPAMLSLAGYRTVAVEKLGLLETALINSRVRALNRWQQRSVLETETAYDDLLLRRLLRHLNDGKIVFIMGDYHGDRSSRRCMRVDFLGHGVVAGRAVAWLHKKSGAPIFPMLSERDEEGEHFRLLTEMVFDTNTEQQYVTQAIYHTIERAIFEHPEKWVLWMDYHMMLPKPQDGSLQVTPSTQVYG